MMRMMNNKAECERFSPSSLLLFFIIGIGALAYTQMATPTGSSGTSTIGVINYIRMMSQDNPIYISASSKNI